ncbi:MAG TPA: phenylalanine--tRNA ligase subunit beta, partial [Naasia sp.]
GLDPEVGTDALALLGLDDAAVEVNVTPDRGYAFSVRGIAREYAHSTGTAFRDPADAVPPTTGSGFPVTVDDRAPLRGRPGVLRFSTRVVRGIDPARPTPPWLASRLRLSGIRSISLPVDITNYVMLELGQPIHAYDLDRLTGGLTVRRATPGERLETLDGQQRTLTGEDLVIADDSGPVGLAGVMGGAATEVKPETRDVLIEAGIFDPVSIARTARRQKLPSEASKRYERGVDPAVNGPAVSRVVQLLVELAGGTADALGSDYDDTAAPAPIALPAAFPARLIGVDYTPAEIRSALVEIGAVVEDAADGFTVTPPTWRPDLTDAASLTEEIARLTGYDRIPSVLPVAPPGRGLTRAQQLRRSAARMLAANGATEVLAFPFVREAQNDLFGAAEPGSVPAMRLANPMDGEAPYLRTSLLPGLLEVAHRNRSRGFVDLDIFEIGAVFRPEAGVEYGTDFVPPTAERPADDVLALLDASLPPQPRHVATVQFGSAVAKQPGQDALAADWRDALTSVQQVAASLRVRIRPVQGSHQAFHPGRTARLVVDGPGGEETVGWAGELLPAVAEAADLPPVVAAAELDLDRLIELADPDPHAVLIRALPAAT